MPTTVYGVNASFLGMTMITVLFEGNSWVYIPFYCFSTTWVAIHSSVSQLLNLPVMASQFYTGCGDWNQLAQPNCTTISYQAQDICYLIADIM